MGGFDPNSLLNFLQAQQGNSSGYGPPPTDASQVQATPAAAPAPPSGGQPPAPPQAQPQLGPRLTGIKGYLSNIFYDMGEAAKVQAGIPTDAQKQALAAKQQNEAMAAQANAFEATMRGQLYAAQQGQRHL